MPLTKPIPKTALPVAEILRREVPRPTELPVLMYGDLQWVDAFSSGGINIDCCAMGLAPKATSPNPGSAAEFGYPVSDDAVRAFASWFDSQTDAQATVDAIWPDK